MPESILGLNGLYDRAQRFLDSTDPQEIYGKDTIVAIYLSTEEYIKTYTHYAFEYYPFLSPRETV